MPSTSTGTKPDSVDAVVIGAGFSGLYMVHRLREMGLSHRGFETGSGVGGTWYWNRYPGASSDSESWVYSFSFDDALEQEWNWSTRFPEQPEILSYLEHVADRFDIRHAFDFDTTVTGATFDGDTDGWMVTTSGGETVRCRFLITAVGCLSAAQVPDFPGRDSFAGESYHTGHWPQDGVDLSGKRVGVIGTGSTGIQAIPRIAKQARHLTVFQRTPQYVAPAGNRPLGDEERARLKREIKGIREYCRWATIGQPYDFRDKGALEVDAGERLKQYEADWRKGGFEFIFGSYNDLVTDEEANETIAAFVRGKIAQIVKDPETARQLTPTDYHIGTKRLPLYAEYYFDTYNRDNVDLVDLKETPIERIVPEGIRTGDRTHELDVIVFATGFDAMTGPLTRMGIVGRGGVALKDKWADGPATYLGVSTAGFPNLFMITGPGSPSVSGNMPTTIEQNVEWISGCIEELRARSASYIEPDERAEQEWVAHVNEVADATLFPRTNSWYVGANIPGKPRVFMPYIGGFGTYRERANKVAENDYEGFVIR